MILFREEKPRPKEHYEVMEAAKMSAELLIQLLVLIVMIIELATKSGKS